MQIQNLLVPDKPTGFEPARAGFDCLCENIGILPGFVGGATVQRLIGFGIIHSNRERRWGGTAACLQELKGCNECEKDSLQSLSA
jgi:hypothetical protein